MTFNVVLLLGTQHRRRSSSLSPPPPPPPLCGVSGSRWMRRRRRRRRTDCCWHLHCETATVAASHTHAYQSKCRSFTCPSDARPTHRTIWQRAMSANRRFGARARLLSVKSLYRRQHNKRARARAHHLTQIQVDACGTCARTVAVLRCWPEPRLLHGHKRTNSDFG